MSLSRFSQNLFIAFAIFLMSLPALPHSFDAADKVDEDIRRYDGYMTSALSGAKYYFPQETEYLVLVIDNSGSMHHYSWSALNALVQKVLETFPKLKGFRIFNHIGEEIDINPDGKWLSNTSNQKRKALDRLRSWHSSNNSSILSGLIHTLNSLNENEENISVFLMGDEETTEDWDSIATKIDAISSIIKTQTATVKIHAIGFPVQFFRPSTLQATGVRYAAAAREVAVSSGGVFIGLNSSTVNNPTPQKANVSHKPGLAQRIVTLLDTSQSMQPAGSVLRPPYGTAVKKGMLIDERLAQAQQAVLQVVDSLPMGSRFQLYTFDQESHPLLPQSAREWLNLPSPGAKVQIAKALSNITAAGPKNFESAILGLSRISPPPDRVILITDGLPNMGVESGYLGVATSNKARFRLLRAAEERLPEDISLQIIQVSLDGTPFSASEFWRMTTFRDGSFLSVPDHVVKSRP